MMLAIRSGMFFAPPPLQNLSIRVASDMIKNRFICTYMWYYYNGVMARFICHMRCNCKLNCVIILYMFLF